MSISKALNSNNDIFIRNGSFVMASDASEVIQHVRSRLLFYLGEYALDNRIGTSWFQEVFVKPFNPSLVESIIIGVITETEGILNLTEFSMDIVDESTRRLSITFSAETTFGIINDEEVYVNV